jgi:hypothetical protein
MNEFNFTTTFVTGYLAAFSFWLQISLGSIAILMIHNLTGGKWGVRIRPALHQIAALFPLMAALFVPVLIALPSLYVWTNSTFMSSTHQLHNKVLILNQPFFIVRAVIYFSIWIYFARGLRAPTSKPRSWNGLGLMALLFSVSFASMDWLMTTDPTWSSDAFGVVYIGGCFSSAFAFSVLLTLLMERRSSLQFHHSDKTPSVFVDLGNLMLMSVLFWGYMQFMQYLITWSGQLPREIHWYAIRSENGWQWMILFIALFHFAFPFAGLLFRGLKKQSISLFAIALMILGAAVFENLILIAPAEKVSMVSGISTVLLFAALVGVVWAVSLRLIKPFKLESPL